MSSVNMPLKGSFEVLLIVCNRGKDLEISLLQLQIQTKLVKLVFLKKLPVKLVAFCFERGGLVLKKQEQKAIPVLVG